MLTRTHVRAKAGMVKAVVFHVMAFFNHAM
jgi:hypothetical protein